MQAANIILPFKTLTRRVWFHYRTDSLFRNSLYIMLATAVMAGFGFFFWLITARIFTTQNIGLATALISVMNIIAVLSLIGFDSAFVRFLPTSDRRNDELNTGFLLVSTAALILGTLFIIFVPFLSPQINFVRADPLVAIAFILFCVMSALNILTDAVFLAYRETKFTLIINSIFSLIKMLLPFIFAPWGAIGIFTAAAAAQSLGFALSVAALVWKFGYRPKLIIYKHVLRRVWQYCTGNYAAGIFGFIPLMLLPVLVINRLGPDQAAYYYIVMMVGNLLYAIPRATTSSLFAEGSFDESALKDNIKKSNLVIGWLLVPIIAILFMAGKKLLLIFGENYSSGGSTFLYFVAFTGLIVSFYYTYNTIFKVIRDLKSLIISNICYAVAVIGLSYALMSYGLFGIGVAWLLGNLVAAVASFILYRWDIDRKHSSRTENETFYSRIKNLIPDLKIIFSLKIRYYYAWVRRGFKNRAILFYPDKPEFFHLIYKLCHMLGYKITNDPRSAADAVFAFEDRTVRNQDDKLMKLSKDRKVININCPDISKENVEKIFREVFGYGTFIDPSAHHGLCVRKSSDNAKHDGKVVECPAQPEAGYIYQKLINNLEERQALDLRVPILNDRIPPFVFLRYKNANDRFDNTLWAVMADLDDNFSPDEINKILEFSRRFGLEYGELDILRDKDDGRIYIVDVNNTPAGCPQWSASREDYRKYLNKMAQLFAEEFLPK